MSSKREKSSILKPDNHSKAGLSSNTPLKLPDFPSIGVESVTQGGPFDFLFKDEHGKDHVLLHEISNHTGSTVVISTKNEQYHEQYYGIVASTSFEGDAIGVTLKHVKEVSSAQVLKGLFIASIDIEDWTLITPTNYDQWLDQQEPSFIQLAISKFIDSMIAISTKDGHHYEGIVESTSFEGDAPGYIMLNYVKDISNLGAPMDPILCIAAINILKWSSDNLLSERFSDSVCISMECVTPAHAQLHLINHQNVFHQTLVDYGYTGNYSLHSGFDEVTIHLQEPEQEIYIVLDSDVPDGMHAELEEVASPFPCIVLTPDDALEEVGWETGDYSAGPFGLGSAFTESSQDDNGAGDDDWGKGSDWKGKGKDSDQGGLGSRGGGAGGNDAGGGSGGGGGGGSGGGGGGGSEGGDADGEDERRGGGDEDINDTTSATPNGGADHGSIKVPFFSTLASKDRKENFQIFAHINTTEERSIDKLMDQVNKKANSGLWGPSVGVDIEMLRVASLSHADRFTLSQCQTRIVASSCRTNVVHLSPGVVHAEDSSKLREDRSLTGAGSLNISMNPSLRLDGKYGSTKGTERSQQPWVIGSNRLGQNDGLAAGSKGVFWNYIRNFEGGFRPMVREDFNPKPSLEFVLGLERGRCPLVLPKLEVQVAIFWSFASGKRLLSRAFHSKIKGGSEGLPANLNFLHQVSMVVDLQGFGGDDIVIDGDVTDEIPVLLVGGGRTLFGVRQLIPEQWSTLEVTIQQAVEGRIGGPTREQQSMWSIASTSTAPYPTPTASPSHTPPA
ncbi:hypothetical protein DXG01_002921 [Tephrocybe rancida]|nr:hypothetical protein DXG01_002921 [Tephrocybe rancida]